MDEGLDAVVSQMLLQCVPLRMADDEEMPDGDGVIWDEGKDYAGGLRLET